MSVWTLEIREFMQLESQIGIATSYMSSRDTNVGETITPARNPDFLKIIDSQNLILAKIVALIDKPEAKTQSVNVYNNTCSPKQPEMFNKDSQTGNEPSTDQATIVNNPMEDVSEPEDTSENV